MENRESEATIFFIDEVIHDMRRIIKKPPTKNVMKAYVVSWLNTLETVKSLNEK